jgi:sugar lactone lactonase YvrE
VNTVSLTGQHIWTFKDENVIREPIGIALDKNRNVYVAGYETNNVVVLSPEGKNCREILTQRNGLTVNRIGFPVCMLNGTIT